MWHFTEHIVHEYHSSKDKVIHESLLIGKNFPRAILAFQTQKELSTFETMLKAHFWHLTLRLSNVNVTYNTFFVVTTVKGGWLSWLAMHILREMKK